MTPPLELLLLLLLLEVKPPLEVLLLLEVEPPLELLLLLELTPPLGLLLLLELTPPLGLLLLLEPFREPRCRCLTFRRRRSARCCCRWRLTPFAPASGRRARADRAFRALEPHASTPTQAAGSA